MKPLLLKPTISTMEDVEVTIYSVLELIVIDSYVDGSVSHVVLTYFIIYCIHHFLLVFDERHTCHACNKSRLTQIFKLGSSSS